MSFFDNPLSLSAVHGTAGQYQGIDPSMVVPADMGPIGVLLVVCGLFLFFAAIVGRTDNSQEELRSTRRDKWF